MANSQMKNARRNAGVLVAKLAGEAALQNRLDTNHSGNSASAQRGRTLAELQKGPVTTLQARSRLDVMHPGARIMELRKAGHNIVTVWTYDQTSEGQTHRVAKYVLMPGEPA